MTNSQVIVHKSVLMQRLLDSVVRGHYLHTSGIVPVSRAQRLVDKFADRYGIHKTMNQRAYAKRHGHANARLFLYARSGETALQWWLLATPGTGAVHELERLGNAHENRQRLQIENEYELVRRTRPSKHGGGQVWSWRMTRETYRNWRNTIREDCRAPDTGRITQTLGTLYRAPGFSGIRHQIGNLVVLARREWRRYHGNKKELILPPSLPYLERLPTHTVPLAEWCEMADR